MKSLPIAAALLLAALTAGCEASPAARAPAPEPVVADLTRDVAIRTARQDAAARYGDRWIASVDASQLGRYWVIELRAPGGQGMRYAISTADGTIRQRSIFQ